MKTEAAPIRVTFEQVPNSVAVAYVKYRKQHAGSPAPRTTQISPNVGVYVDFDHAGAVLGIELIGVDAESMAVAARFASDNELAFPRDLSGCAADDDDDS
jgi:hypothetical protein